MVAIQQTKKRQTPKTKHQTSNTKMGRAYTNYGFKNSFNLVPQYNNEIYQINKSCSHHIQDLFFCLFVIISTIIFIFLIQILRFTF